METNISSNNSQVTTDRSRPNRGRGRNGPRRGDKKSKDHPTTSQVVSLVKSIKNSKRQLKFFYNDSGIVSIANTANFFDITTQIAQGVTANQRVGSSVELKNIKFNISTVLGDTTNLLRFVIFKWRPSSTSDTPTIGELYSSTTASWVGQYLPYQPSRFQILADITFNMDAAHVQLQHVFSLDCRGIVPQYDIGTPTGINHIFAYYISDSNVVPNPTLRFTTQIEYFDTE